MLLIKEVRLVMRALVWLERRVRRETGGEGWEAKRTEMIWVMCLRVWKEEIGKFGLRLRLLKKKRPDSICRV